MPEPIKPGRGWKEDVHPRPSDTSAQGRGLLLLPVCKCGLYKTRRGRV